jgi:predicted membrane-bound mannosyltransferase
VRALSGERGILALTAFAAVLRFSTLDVQSFGHDESGTAGVVIRPGLFETLGVVVDNEATPPLYYVIAWGWSKLMGTGEVGLRSFSALAGAATVPVAYRATSVLISRRAGLVAAALVAANPMLVWYSQEARSYALLVLLAALSFLFFVEALERPTRGRLAGWAISSALALATHYFAVIVLAPEALWLVMRSRHRRRALAAAAAIVAAGAVLLPLAVHQGVARGRGDWIGKIDFGQRLLDTGQSFLLGETGGAIGAVAISVAAALAWAALLLLAARADREERRGGLLAFYVGVAAVLVSLAMSAFGADFLLAKNLLPALVPLLVAASAGFGARAAGLGGLLAAGALAGLFTGIVTVTAARGDLQRADWRSVAAAIGPAREPRMIVAPQNAGDPLRFYLANARWAHPGRTASVREVIVVGWVAPGELAASLPEGFRRAEQRTLERSGVVVFRARRPARLSPKDLSLTEVGAAAQGPAAVLIEYPAAARVWKHPAR